MALWFRDFSQIRFENDVGPVLPRRQNMRIEGFVGSDSGEEIVLRVSSDGLLASELGSTASVQDGEVRYVSGLYEPGDGGQGSFYSVIGGTAAAFPGMIVEGPGCQWVRLYDGFPSIAFFGCKDDGSNDSAAIINAYIASQVTALGATGGVIGIRIPRVRDGGYFKFLSTVRAPASAVCKLHVKGEGGDTPQRYPFGANYAWLVPGAMFGSVVRVTVEDVDAFAGAASGYAWLTVEDVVIVGPGRGTGAGISTLRTQVSTRNNVIANFHDGIWHQEEISGKNHEGNRIYGCFYGERIGDDAAINSVTDSNWFGSRTEVCNTGVAVRNGWGNAIWGGISQGCGVGLQLGGGVASLGYGIYGFHKHFFEGNGYYAPSGTTVVTAFCRLDCVTVATANDALSGLAARNGVAPSAGQRVLVAGQTNPVDNGPYTAAAGAWSRADVGSTHAGCVYKVTGGTYASTYWQIDNETPAFQDDGDPLVIAQVDTDWDIRVSPVSTSRGHVVFDGCFAAGVSEINSEKLSFRDCSFGGITLNVVSDTVSDYTVWGAETIGANAVYSRVPAKWLSLGGTSGVKNFDWANHGDLITMGTTGDIEIQNVTNAPIGAELQIHIQQGSPGGHMITFTSAFFTVDNYSNIGNKQGAWCVIIARCIGVNRWEGVATSWGPGTEANIYASTTHTQAGAQPLNSYVNQVAVVANPNDCVRLPPAEAGADSQGILVINSGANTLDVYPASGDNLGAGVNTPTTQAAGVTNRYVAYDSTNWVKL